MKINFKKISAIVTSTLMVGMTMGVAAAANYPAPFVESGAANVAIVYGTGTGVSYLDTLSAGDVQTDLQRYLSGGTGGTGTTVSGEAISLDSGSTRIYLNTSLNTAKSTLTKTDLPTVLADYTFSGNVDSKITETIKIQSGAAAGGDNSGKVIFAKQPKSSNDPAIGISLGSSQTSNPLYNLSATMSAVAFNDSSSEGEEIMLFGQKFTVASETDGTDLVLLKEAQRFSLDSDNPSTTVTIGGATYTVELVSTSDTAATIKVTDSAGVSNSREVNEAASKKIQGLEIAVVNADETNLKLSATIIAGADKLTFTNGATVTKGSDDDPIDGTFVYLVGGTSALTELAVTVFRPDSSNDAILEGQSFVDPVFGSFKVDFTKMSIPLADTNRDTFSVQNSADDTMTMTMLNSAGVAKTFDIAHNQSSQWFLGDDSNYTINVMEMSNLSENEYIVVGNEDYGRILEVTQIYNNTGTDHTNDRVKLTNVLDGTDVYDTTFTSEGSGTIDIGGKRYTVTFGGSGDTGWTTIKYPTSESANANTAIIFPTVQTKGGALVALYQPTTINLANFDGSGSDLTTLKIPDGDGYTSISLEYVGNLSDDLSWNVTGGGVTDEPLNTNAADSVDFTIGELVYNLTRSAVNTTVLYVTDPEGTANIDNPGVIILEGKDDNTEYHGIVVDFDTAPAGNSDSGVGVSDILFSSNTHYSQTLQSDSDMTKDIDWFGTLVTTDASDSDQKTVSISYPESQIYAELYVGEVSSAITPGTTGTTGSSTSIGAIKVRDSEVASSKAKNLIIIGGSCINSAAATLVGGSYCGEAWTTATGTGAGQFLIKSYATSTLTDAGKIALLVAGYNAEDTVNAATYLQTQPVDTSKNYKGTSSTTATVESTTTA